MAAATEAKIELIAQAINNSLCASVFDCNDPSVETLTITSLDLNYSDKVLNYVCGHLDRSLQGYEATIFHNWEFPDNYIPNFNELNRKFELEMAHYASYIKGEMAEAIKTFEFLAAALAYLPFEKVAVELNPNNAITCTLAFKNNIILILSKPFYKTEELGEDELIATLFHQKERIFSDAKGLADLVKDVKEFLSLPSVSNQG